MSLSVEPNGRAALRLASKPMWLTQEADSALIPVIAFDSVLIPLGEF